jgi:PAS domain S-box-containing protein
MVRALGLAVHDALVITDYAGVVTSWSEAATRLLGRTADEVVGQAWTRLVGADSRASDAAISTRVNQGEIIRDARLSCVRGDGSERALMVTAVPLDDEAGTVVGTVRVLRPAERDRLAARRLAALVASSDDAIASKTLDGIVTSWNPAAERMFGYTAAEMIGASIRRIIPADRQSEEDEVLARIRRGERIEHFDTVRQRKDGTLIPISLSVSPIRDEGGTVVGASKIARDITDRVKADEERARLLELSQRQTSITEKLNHVGRTVAATLDREAVVQAVTDAATELTSAHFGAFFYNVVNERGESYTLYTISGVPREHFAQFPMPRNTAVFEPTFRGVGVVRSDDITKDPRYGLNAPYHGQPPGHLPVRSYLAVPVMAPSGAVLGGLFFGHETAGRFTAEHESLAEGIAAWASVALENARLYSALKDAGRLKDEFLATLSHELRTPLNAILGYIRMLRGRVLGADRQSRALETVERNAASLANIVEDVLDVSRIVAGKIRLNVQRVEPIDVVRDAIDALRPTADVKGIRVQAVLDPDAGPVAGDPDRLQQVAWNLLSNAIKFTPKNGRIQVRLERVDSSVAIVVSDTGIGISSDFLPHVFERFRQEDAGTARARGGLGLGLSIVHQLVELHGGTITAASEGPGTGSTFCVVLPIMLAATSSMVEEPARVPVSIETPQDPPDLSGISVLAVDDDADALNMVRDMLEAHGATVSTAASAESAMDALASGRPDVVVADLGMPHVDGFALIARIRQSEDPAVGRVPAAALSAYARSEDRTRALRAGFDMHLAKPINPAELVESVLALSRSRGR